MQRFLTGVLSAAAAAAVIAAAGSGPAAAQVGAPRIATAVAQPASGLTEVRWRGRGGWHGGWHHRGGWGVGAGFATGLLFGGLMAAPYYGYPGPYYAYPGRYYAPAPGDAVAYCMRRFRSYDPASGTYLGYDGYRHPCP